MSVCVCARECAKENEKVKGRVREQPDFTLNQPHLPRYSSTHRFDLLKVRDVVLCHKRHCAARATGTRSSAHAMHINIRRLWEVVVDHKLDVGNVQTTRAHVGAHHHTDNGRQSYTQTHRQTQAPNK